MTKRPSRKFVGCEITWAVARGVLARPLLDTGFGTTGVWQQERRSAATAQIGGHGQIRTADLSLRRRPLQAPACGEDRCVPRGAHEKRRPRRRRGLRDGVPNSCGYCVVPVKRGATPGYDQSGQRADSRLIITTSRYSPGRTSVASPERLRPFTRAIKSSCNADCLVASRAAKALRMGP